jgi:hypothetical protein
MRRISFCRHESYWRHCFWAHSAALGASSHLRTECRSNRVLPAEPGQLTPGPSGRGCPLGRKARPLRGDHLPCRRAFDGGVAWWSVAPRR